MREGLSRQLHLEAAAYRHLSQLRLDLDLQILRHQRHEPSLGEKCKSAYRPSRTPSPNELLGRLAHRTGPPSPPPTHIETWAIHSARFILPNFIPATLSYLDTTSAPAHLAWVRHRPPHPPLLKEAHRQPLPWITTTRATIRLTASFVVGAWRYRTR